MFQSTRPRGARHAEVTEDGEFLIVSIHAPARGATRRTDAPPTPTRFNPRAREGRDMRSSKKKEHYARFNPRAREGRDTTRPRNSGGAWKFQSTRPRGARRTDSGALVHALRCFNPRAREGRDFFSRANRCGILLVSIHAPARGATRDAPRRRRTARFQSTRPRGARPRRTDAPPTPTRFNPRAREGRDAADDVRIVAAAPDGFNPRAREGRDGARMRRVECQRVSIHAPARGATIRRRPA